MTFDCCKCAASDGSPPSRLRREDALPRTKTAAEPADAASIRISIWVPSAMMQEIDRVNDALTAGSGVTINRSHAARIGLLVYAKTAAAVAIGRRIWSLNDLENAFLEALQPRPATAVPAEAQRLLQQIAELQQQLATIMGNPAPAAEG